MTVKELITKLLDCDLDAKIVLSDNICFENENGKVNGSLYEIEDVHEYAKMCCLEFINRNSKYY